jgi:hypothetical protein
MLKNTMHDKKRVPNRSSAELEQAVRQHREHARQVLSDVKNRRAETGDTTPPGQPDHPIDT